ncbi:MAG: metalloregulator ArsR/SmtB family transcription factor [Syntrophomonas sp.]
MIQQICSIFKALGEPTRLTIMKFLSIQELCICELVAIMDMSQPRISQHVKVLKQAGVVKERKVKQKSYFSVNPAILNDAIIGPWASFMQCSIDSIPELADENQRYLQLDSNEEVLACKNGCGMESAEVKQII